MSPIGLNHKDKYKKSIDTCLFMYAYNPLDITYIQASQSFIRIFQ